MHRKVTLSWLLALTLVLVTGQATFADVKPHALFSDGMVLQRDANLVVWGTADADEMVTVEFQGNAVKAAVKDGRWEAPIGKYKAGGPFEMTIRGKNNIKLKDVYVGEVWVCSGQSNMVWPIRASAEPEIAKANAKYPKVRFFVVPNTTAKEPQKDVKGTWKACSPETVVNFSAVAYYFGRDLHQKLDVPVGLIQTAWGGTRAEAWTSRPALEALPDYKEVFEQQAKEDASFPERLKRYETAVQEHKKAVEKARAEGKQPPPAPRRPPEPDKNPNAPSVLYNAMIAPLIPYTIKGVIWYQGESNAGRAYHYRTLFPAMIKNWRTDWKQGDFPFLFVQLAPFRPNVPANTPEVAWAELRDAQLHTSLTVPNTAMAVITDAGEEKDVHPKLKEPVGARLALAARALAYGEKIVYSGPIYTDMKVQGNKASLGFKHVGGGLLAKGEKLQGFTVAGEDRKFVDAEAVIEGDRIIVSSPKVDKPVAVRYGWTNFPVVNLFNKEGLPASPFRTDDFPMLTAPKPGAGAK